MHGTRVWQRSLPRLNHYVLCAKPCVPELNWFRHAEDADPTLPRASCFVKDGRVLMTIRHPLDDGWKHFLRDVEDENAQRVCLGLPKL